MTTKTSSCPKNPPRRRMVRKQIYIYPQQDEQIKRLAQTRSTSEAELIREAIEELLGRQSSHTSRFLPPDESAWQALLHSMREHSSQFSEGEPHRWRREDYYDDERTARLNERSG